MRSKAIAFSKYNLYSLPLLAILGLLTEPVWVQRTQIDLQKVSVEVLVTDGWGKAINNARIEIISIGRTRVILQYPKEHSFSAAPGSYTLTVDAENYRKFAKSVTVGQQGMIVTLCVCMAPIENSEYDRPPSLIGTVGKRYLSDQPVWLRLTGYYYEFNSTSLVDNEGAFIFSGLQPGKYYLMLFSGSTFKEGREVAVMAVDTKVNVQ